MIEQLIPVSVTSEEQLPDHITSGRIGYSKSLNLTPRMGQALLRFAPTSASRDPWPNTISFEHTLWTDDRFALQNNRPLSGKINKLARNSLAIAQQIASPEHLDAVEPRTYVGIIQRKSATTEVFEYIGDGDVEQLAIHGLFSYLTNPNQQPATAEYRQNALDLQTLIADRQKKYEYTETNRIVTPEFIKGIPLTASELGKLWEEKHQAKYGQGATKESKAAADEFFMAMKFIGLDGQPDSIRDWYDRAYQRGTEYNLEHDAITQHRLDILHSDHDAVVRAIADRGHFFTHEEYRSISPGRPGY